MSVTDLFDEWDTTLAELCAGFDKPCTNERRAAYRNGLGKLPPIAWKRLVDHCLSEQGPDKFPTVNLLWQIHRKLRATYRPPTVQPDNTQPISGSLSRVNGMFLQWMRAEILSDQRVPFRNGPGGEPRSIPDRELAERRGACIDLAQAHDILLAENNRYATDDRLAASFAETMNRIPRESQPGSEKFGASAQ